ncbi:MAG: hypothetical protein R3E92_25295 [Burkholderiaceae bacterium]|nr:hypothetical protein [Rhodoferax sp.]MCB2044197.1 hypothetical protein [Rhodoferax sp.]
MPIVALARPVLLAAALLAGAANPVLAQESRNLAPGFTTCAASAKLVVVPVDIELFSISGGGVAEPRADWTQQAQAHFHAALDGAQGLLGGQIVRLDEQALDEMAEINALHGAVAEAVFFHHMAGFIKLPTKNGVLDWSLGDAVQPLKAASGADYALFTWVRDSYASSERKAVMVGMALLGIGLAGGIQVGYASLVDLNNGRIVWFNNLSRGTGDLREAASARETVEALFKRFPATR